MAFHRLTFVFVVLAFSGSFGTFGSIARGQGFFQPRGFQPGRFIEAPRNILQHLREAQQALEEQRYSDAVVRLGDLLASETEDLDDLALAGQDFFLEMDDARATGTPLGNSILRAAREMIGRLPSKAMETYELRYGPLARRMLREASHSRDWVRVREVRRKYFHTMAGYEASLILAQHELFEGQALACSLLLDDVVRVPHARRHLGVGVVLLHASAAKIAGRSLRADEFPYMSEPAFDEVEVGGKSQKPPAGKELLAWLAERVGGFESSGTATIDGYPMFGAQPNRNGTNAGQLPLSNLRWKQLTTTSPRQERRIRKSAEELTTSGKLPPPSWIPLRVGDQLMMRTTKRLVGVDYRTGKAVWIYPWQSNAEELHHENSSLDEAVGEQDNSKDLLTQRVWNDVPYGQISSDGERVFLLNHLKKVEMTSFSALANLRGTRPADTRSNTLVALDLATEGKLLWRLGAAAGEVNAFSDAFFLGPPLPLDGRLYVMVEIAGDINLCCLDPVTGNEWWRQHLVAVESGSIDRDPVRRVAGAMPTYHQGVLVCPTGAGATVAIDLGDRMLRWGVNYERNPETRGFRGGRNRNPDPNRLMQRWHNGAAIATSDVVLVTPIESDRLLGLSLLTGERLFPPRPRVNMRYLAGIRGDLFFVVGSNHVRAFDLKTGDEKWTTPRDMLAAGQQISGRGVFGEDSYLVPTTSNQIVQVSLADGTIMQRRDTRFPLGNLVATGGELISQGPLTLAVAFGEVSLEPIINRMLAENPDDFEAMVRKSELLIQRGQRQEALRLLQRARASDPENDEVRMLSVSAMLGTLREDPDATLEMVAELDELIDQPSQRVEFLSLRIRSSIDKGEYEQAVELLFDMSSLIVSEPLLESAAPQVVNDASRQCSLDNWVMARVDEISLAASQETLDVIHHRLHQRSESQFSDATSLLSRTVRHFSRLSGIQPIREELAKRYAKDGQYLQLERLALETKIPSLETLESLPGESLVLLAQAYSRGRMTKDANFVINLLSRREALSPAVTESLVELRKDMAAGSQSLDFEWPKKVTLKWDSRRTRIGNFSMLQRSSKTSVMAGREFVGWQLVSENTSPLALRDQTGLLRRIPATTTGQRNEIDKEAAISGGVMVVVMTSGLVGVDLFQLLSGDGEAVLWRRGLSGDGGPVAKRGTVPTPFEAQVVHYNISSSGTGRVIPELKVGPIMGDRVLVLQGGDLMAIDLLTNETLWRNSGSPKRGALVCDGRRVAVVSPMTSEVVFFDLLDGRKLETRKWDHGKYWESIGSNVLVYRETGQDVPYELRLVNPFTGEVLLSETVHSENRSSGNKPCGYGRVLDGRYLTFVESSGTAFVWDLMEGREIGRPKLPAYPDLQSLQAMQLKGQILLLPKRRMLRSKVPLTEQLQTTHGSFHRTVHGVFAVSMKNGSLRWKKEFERPWGCTLTQPNETPILVLTRGKATFKSTQSRRKRLDVLAIDVRDGSQASQFLDRDTTDGNNSLETRLTIQPTLSRVIAQMGPELLTYSFGESTDPSPKKVTLPTVPPDVE